MPYVDQGEPKPAKPMPPIVSIMAVVVAAIVTPALWLFCHKWFGYSYVGAPLGGLTIGMAAKFTLRRPFPPLRVFAIILLVIGSFAGFVWVDSKIWSPFMLDKSTERFFRDILALLFTGVGCYLTFVLASPRGPQNP